MRQIRTITYCLLLFACGLIPAVSISAQSPNAPLQDSPQEQELREQFGLPKPKFPAQPGDNNLPVITPAQRGMVPSEVQQSIGQQQEEIAKLETALEAFEAEDYGNGLEGMQSILENKNDLLLDPKQFPEFSDIQPLSIKNVVLKLLDDLPPEAKRVYDLQQGTAAEARYAELKQETDPARRLELLKELIRLYPQTTSGQQAAIQLGNLYFDRFDFATAIRYYERALATSVAGKDRTQISVRLVWAYREIGDARRAEEILNRLKAENGETQVTLGDRSFPLAELTLANLPTTSAALSASNLPPLEDWTQSRGDASRNVVATAIPTGEPLWRSDLLAAAFRMRMDQLAPARKIIQELIDATETHELELISVNEPLKVGDLIVTRTLAGVEARSEDTGEIVWRDVQVDSEFESAIIRDQRPEATLGNGRSGLENLLRAKLWNNARSQSISSNGEFVYALDRVQPVDEPGQQARVLGGGPRPTERFNRLYALDSRTGKIQWEIGGTRQYQILPLAGYFFMGAPLCVEDELYALAISGSELVLLALDAKTGRLIQQMPVDVLSQPETEQLLLSNYEISPTLLGDLLICPTVNGYLHAYDLAEERWIWTTKYPSFSPTFPAMVDDSYDLYGETTTTGAEAIAIAGDGHVVLAPPDSPLYITINAATGKQVWSRERRDLITPIGILQRHLYVLNRGDIESIELGSGKTVWKSSLDAVPSGRPLLTGNLIHVPLSSGIIMSLQVEDGRTRSQYLLQPDQTRGILFAGEGKLFCQSEEFLVAFPSAEAAHEQVESALAATPAAEEPRYQRAHELLMNGERQQGVALLRTMIRENDSPGARRLLIRLLKEKVKYEPDDAEPVITELLALSSTAHDAFSVLQLIVDRYVDRGEYALAFEAALSFIEKNKSDSLPLVKLEKTSINPILWFRSEIADWQTKLSEAERQAVNERVREVVAGLPEDDLNALAQLEIAFRDLPEAALLQERLVAAYDDQIAQLQGDEGTPYIDRQLSRMEFQRNFHLRQLARSASPTALASAKRYYDELEKTNERELMLEWLKVFAEKFGDEVIEDELTGATFVERERSRLREAIRGEDTFRKVESFDIQQYPSNSPTANFQRYELRHFVDRPGPFTPYRFFWNTSSHELEIETRLQKTQWSVPMSHRSLQSLSSDQTAIFSSGPFLLVLMNSDLTVFRSRGPDQPLVMLWSRELKESEEESTTISIHRSVPWYSPSLPLGPVIEDRCYFRIGSTLYAVDVKTGEDLWQVRHVSYSSLVFGRDSILGLLTSESQAQHQLIALDALTGEIRNTIHPPLGHQPTAVLANECVFADRTGNGLVYYSQNIETGEIIWKHTFAADAIDEVIRDESQDHVAILDPDGNFHAIDLLSGQLIAEIKVDPVPNLQRMRVVGSEDQYLVLMQKETEGPGTTYQYYGGYDDRSMLVNAGCFAVNRKTLDLEWQQQLPEPMLYNDQSSDLPLVMLTVRTSEPQGNFRTRHLLKTKVLDRRTGKITFEYEIPAGLDKFDIDLSPEKQRIEYRFRDFTIRATPAEEQSSDALPAKEPSVDNEPDNE